MDLPRTALLTWCSPDSRYAGGAAVRRLLGRLPADRIRWCGFRAGTAAPGLPEYRAFPPHTVHWRLRGTWVEHAVVDQLQARRLARRMWAWLQPFDPQVLWVFPEVWAVAVGQALQELSGLPLHATVHDAPESAGFGAIPPSYMPAYERRMRQLLRRARSVDAVSDELVDHLRRGCGLATTADALVVPPCVEADTLLPVTEFAPPDAAVRRIGLCGSVRETPAQWADFLQVLGRMPYQFSLVSFTAQQDLPDVATPSNVMMAPQPYAPTEQDVIRALSRTEACYLGLWTEPSRRLFAATSVSSKLTTYAAAARPVIVDAPACSVAWRLVAHHGAGVRVGEMPAADATVALQHLFSGGKAWRSMAEGAHRLGRETFALEPHVAHLQDQLARTAAKGTGR
ncbi:MAG: glycosyltransferase [Lentisphaerae bacterium]|nr:glycosyltransferase [Lentisphaerota bacterium]